MKEKLSMFAFVVILGTLLTTALAAVDSYTTPIINRNQELKRKATILKAFAIPSEPANVEDLFVQNVQEKGVGERQYYRAHDGRIAYLFKGSGLWGPIEGVLAVQPDLQTVYRVEIIHQEETPGLGSRIAERDFLDRFNAKIFAPQLECVAEGKGHTAQQIDGITGATMSSKALVVILNAQYELLRQTVAGE